MEMTGKPDRRMSDAITYYPQNGYLNAAPSPMHYHPPFDGYRYEQVDHALPNTMFSPYGEVFTPYQAQFQFYEHLDRQFPRLPIGPSTLSAYSFMRATNTHFNDPLHSALHIHQSRNYPDQRRIQLHLVSRRHSMDSLPRGTTFFWDPLDEPPRVIIPHVPFDPFKPPPSNVTYEEHLRQFPPSVGTNHYKGDMVWQNFGYVKINGRWVDPESEGDLADAFNAIDIGNDEAPYLPDIPKRPDTGPKIMTPEEQMAFYQEYTDEVTDDLDAEGDPRDHRIAPATFARWAAGCGTGERYVEEPFVPGPKLPPPNPSYENEILPMLPRQSQYDMETGSAISGIFEHDPDPRVVRNAQGVDILRIPATFHRSYPQVAIDLDTQAFGNGQMYGPASSIASTPEVFNSENGISNVAPKLGDRTIGELIIEDTREKMHTTRLEISAGNEHNLDAVASARTAAKQRTDLDREVFFLKEKLASMPPPNSMSSTSSNRTMTPATHSDHLSHHQLDGPASPLSPKPPLRRRKQYPRHFREERERSETALKRTLEFGKRIESDHQEILAEIADLRGQREDLLAKLGARSITDLPGLLPLPVISDPRKEMNAKFGA